MERNEALFALECLLWALSAAAFGMWLSGCAGIPVTRATPSDLDRCFYADGKTPRTQVDLEEQYYCYNRFGE